MVERWNDAFSTHMPQYSKFQPPFLEVQTIVIAQVEDRWQAPA